MHFNLTQWGLLLDVVGVLLLFRYGFPAVITPEQGESLIDTFHRKRLSNINLKNRNIFLLSHLGLVLIFAGFILQFFGARD